MQRFKPVGRVDICPAAPRRFLHRIACHGKVRIYSFEHLAMESLLPAVGYPGEANVRVERPILKNLARRDNLGHGRWRNVPGADDHDTGKLTISVKVAMKWHVDNHSPGVLRGVHEVQNTHSVAIGQTNMFGETFRPVSTDTDKVAVLNSGFDSRDLSFWDMVGGPA